MIPWKVRNRGRSLLFVLCLSCSLISAGQTVYPKGAYLDKSLMELPAISSSDNIIVHSGYVSSYNTNTLIPDWVAYELTAEEVRGTFSRSGSFGMDPSFSGRQAMREDYGNSGWDKGHLAPAADMKWSSNAMFESFYFTNICPQNHTMNERSWQRLEKYVRDIAVRFNRVWVVTGPVVDLGAHGTIGRQEVAVPDSFFKAILVLDNGEYHSIAFLMDNNSTYHSIKSSSLTVNELELFIGHNLFCNLPKRIQEKIEDGLDLSYWSIE